MSTSESGIQPTQNAKAKIYWQATRAFSFPASIAPVLLGSALAWRGYGLPGVTSTGAFNPFVFVLTLIGAILAHASGNVLNDYYDYVRGVDTKPEHGSGLIVRGLLTQQETLGFGIALLTGAAICGGAIILLVPGIALMVALYALVGAACAILYTSLLKRYALGDFVIITAFGIGLTTGAYAVQQPFVSGEQFGFIALATLPVALLVDAILNANNMRDAADDAACGIYTVATILGTKGSAALQAFLLFAPVALVVIGALLHLLPLASIAVVLALPLLVKAYRSGRVPFVAQSHLIFGVLYSLTVAVFPR